MPFQNILEIFHIHNFYIFLINTFHSNLHPKNLIIKNKNYYFINTKTISKINPKIQTKLFKFIIHLSKYNYNSYTHTLNHMTNHKIHNKTFNHYYKKLLKLYKDFTNKTISKINLTKKIIETIKLNINSNIIFKKKIFPIIKNIIYLNNIILKDTPDTILIKKMHHFIKKFIKTDTILKK